MKKFLSVCLLAASFLTAQAKGYGIGDMVHDFSLKNVDGRTVSLADYKDAKGYIVVFTCNTCPVALAYQDRIIELSRKYAAAGYPVLAINPNDPEAQPADAYEKMQERAQEKHFDFPYLYDPGQVVTSAFGATNTPHVFLLQKTGKGNMVVYMGAIDNDPEDNNKASRKNFLEDAVAAVQKGQQPAVQQTKAIGCTVKWKKG